MEALRKWTSLSLGAPELQRVSFLMESLRKSMVFISSLPGSLVLWSMGIQRCPMTVGADCRETIHFALLFLTGTRKSSKSSKTKKIKKNQIFSTLWARGRAAKSSKSSKHLNKIKYFQHCGLGSCPMGP